MAKILFSTVILTLMGSLSMATPSDVFSNEKRTIGWLERVYLPEYDLVVRAKVDTGAKNSSIHALDVKYIEQEGKPPVARIRFKTIDIKGKSRIIETDVLGQVRVKNSGGPAETRPEIELDICLAGVKKRIRVNLSDRSEMNYRMILGRTALAGDFIVDISEKYIANSGCPKE